MTAITLAVAIFLFIICTILGYFLVKTSSAFRRYKEEEVSRTNAIRQQAIRDSRRVLGGKFTEQMAPYLPDFKYDPTEARFIGSPIDLIVFPGLAKEEPSELVLIEVKSGKNDRLTATEKRIRDLIEAGRVRWELLYRPQPEG